MNPKEIDWKYIKNGKYDMIIILKEDHFNVMLIITVSLLNSKTKKIKKKKEKVFFIISYESQNEFLEMVKELKKEKEVIKVGMIHG